MSDPQPTSPRTAAPAWSAQELVGNPHDQPDKAQRVQRMFGAIAGRYDLNNRLHSFGRDQAWRRAAVRLAAVKPTDHVLDVACGSGDLSFAFARAGAASVLGVDFTEEMLDVARVKAAKFGAAGKVTPEFRWADAMNLPFDDAAFDVVSIAFGIRNVARPDAALGEFRRVLRDGGRLMILEFTQPRNRVLRSLNHFYTSRIMPLTATMIAGDRSGAYRYLPRSIDTFAEEQTLSGLMSDAGFASISLAPMTFGVCTVYVGVASTPDNV